MDKQQCDLTVVGSIRMADGIGRQSVELIQCLENDLAISFIPLNSYQTSEVERLGEKTRRILSKSGRICPGKVLVFEEMLTNLPRDASCPLKYWQNFRISPLDDTQVRMAYSMFESSRICSEWVGILNKHFDVVLVPDPFLVKVYKKSGVKIPIFVLPLGLDLSSFLSSPLKKKAGKPMVFANFGTCFPRKNHVTLIRAFAQAFGDSSDVSLWLGWRGYFPPYVREVEREISKYHLHNVHIESRGVDQALYLRRFRNVDCYVSLSKGEGFSIQPREAMALGIPTIVTNSTGQKTICSCDAVRAVPAPLHPPATYNFPGIFGHFQDCTVDAAADALRDVYKNYDAYLLSADQRRKWVSSCSYESLRNLYLCVLKPKEIILGECDKITEKGIMTQDEKFACKFARLLGIQVRALSPSELKVKN
jgi:glycosyltransferase involved in cell wall biosynthesis